MATSKKGSTKPATLDDIKGELDCIKSALVKENKNSWRSIWLAPASVSLTLVITALSGSVANPTKEWWLYGGSVLFLVSILFGLFGWRLKTKKWR